MQRPLGKWCISPEDAPARAPVLSPPGAPPRRTSAPPPPCRGAVNVWLVGADGLGRRRAGPGCAWYRTRAGRVQAKGRPGAGEGPAVVRQIAVVLRFGYLFIP